MAKLKDFFNKISNNNRIFTAEDIGEMSNNEFSRNEKAINYQMGNLGIPRRNDLNGNSDVVFVQAYTRADGTEVKAHYRAKNGGIMTGAATNLNPQNQRSTIDDYSNAIDNVIIGLPNKLLLNKAINIVGKRTHQNDAVALWNISSHGFQNQNNNDYISRNGTLYNDINSLGNEYTQYKSKIKEKVKSQFGKEDVPGIVFHENSSVANAISRSQELNDFVNKNATVLKSGKEVTGSLGFNSDANLHNAFGKVDVLSAKMKNGYIDVTILDTYDFNPNEKDWKVQMGYSVQKANLLNPYYTIVKCRYKV